MTVANLTEADLNTMTLCNARPIRQLGSDSRDIPYRLILESSSRCDPLLPKVLDPRSAAAQHSHLDHPSQDGQPVFSPASSSSSSNTGVNSGEMTGVAGESPSNLCFRQPGILEALYGAGDRWGRIPDPSSWFSAPYEGVVSDDWVIYDHYPGHSLRW